MRPHPLSVLRTPDQRVIELKIHGCVWSGEFPENSLPAIMECLRQPVARAEIDINLLRDADFLVTHDSYLDGATTGSGLVRETTRKDAQQLRCRWGERTWDECPPLLSDVVEVLRENRSPTMVELDAKDVQPWPWPRVEELARLVEPVRDRVVFGGGSDWNLRRLVEVDPGIRVGFTPTYYLDWAASLADADELPGVLGAYGYLDRHPLARDRSGPTPEYLWDRLSGLARLVPGARELHLRLSLFERMRADGFTDVSQKLHGLGLRVDVWTLDAETPHWEKRLACAIDAGVDVITSNTAQRLAAAYLG